MDSIGGYKIRDQYALHYWTMTIVGWVDIFSRKLYKDIVIDNLKYYQKEGLVICAYVIMSNHIHMIGYAKEGSRGLSGFIRDLKKSIARQSLLQLDNPKESRRSC